jgi:transposase
MIPFHLFSQNSVLTHTLKPGSFFLVLFGTTGRGCGKTHLYLVGDEIQGSMRGNQDEQEEVFSYIPLEKRVPQDHPLRRVREMADRALLELSGWFDSLYAQTGRPSIPPEQLLRAQILQALYTIRSERQLMDQIDGNWRYRWFVGLKVDDAVWDVTVFTKNRDRLLQGEVSQKFFERVRAQAEAAGLLDDEHFTVDGTLLEAWASRDSFEPKKDPPQRGSGVRGRKLLRDLHESKTDPEARLYKKSAQGPSKPSYLGHVITENKNGLIVQSCVTEAGRRAELDAALGMLAAIAGGAREITVAAIRTKNASLGCARCAWFLWWLSLRRRRTGRTGCRKANAGIRALPAARRRDAGWRKCSPGSRRWRDCARPSCADGHGSTGFSGSRRRRTTWCAC